MQQRLWPREPTIFTDCPCMSSHIQERTHRIPLNLGVSISWAQKWWQDKWPNFNFKIFVYAPEFHFLTFPLDYFQDHFSNKQESCPSPHPTPNPPYIHTHLKSAIQEEGSLCCVEIPAVTRSHILFHHLIPQERDGQVLSRWCRDGFLWEASSGELNSGEELMSLRASQEGCKLWILVIERKRN